jgi:hypothetical protein
MAEVPGTPGQLKWPRLTEGAKTNAGRGWGLISKVEMIAKKKAKV